MFSHMYVSSTLGGTIVQYPMNNLGHVDIRFIFRIFKEKKTELGGKAYGIKFRCLLSMLFSFISAVIYFMNCI